MARVSKRMLRAAESMLALQEAELADLRNRLMVTVTARTASGTGDIDALFSLDGRFRLVFLRAHFTGGSATGPLVLSVDSAAGTAHDTKLFTITQAGPGKDVHLRIGSGDTGEPAAWTFQAGDALRVQWTDPNGGSTSWGLEAGLAPAS